jgi:ubiquinone/menaquinone biosynthesis C-methylase UbiE
MTETTRSFLPAAGHDVFLPFYDAFTRLMGVDRDRRALLSQARLEGGQRVLDLGCGTGTFVVGLKRHHGDVDAVGLDPDPKALARARGKLRRAGVEVQLDRGFADTLPYADASFDRVFSSFMFHHLDPGDKGKAFLEIHRVLRPDGLFEMVDFGGPDHRDRGLLRRLLHSQDLLADNREDRVLGLMKDAGFSETRVVNRRQALFGRIVQYEARR